MANTKAQLEAGKMFHIYNHAVGKDVFFNSDENYNFFLLNYLRNVIIYTHNNPIEAGFVKKQSEWKFLLSFPISIFYVFLTQKLYR